MRYWHGYTAVSTKVGKLKVMPCVYTPRWHIVVLSDFYRIVILFIHMDTEIPCTNQSAYNIYKTRTMKWQMQVSLGQFSYRSQNANQRYVGDSMCRLLSSRHWKEMVLRHVPYSRIAAVIRDAMTLTWRHANVIWTSYSSPVGVTESYRRSARGNDYIFGVNFVSKQEATFTNMV